ncbi:MAG: hypothetical protein H0W19_07810 [Nitrosopumilus sp.]|nr:hypothetical protein [Nitrosopumilus sp.]
MSPVVWSWKTPLAGVQLQSCPSGQTSCNCYILGNGYLMTMPRLLFQPDPINGYEFNPIPIDIHLGVIKIPTEEILDDYFLVD